jgi:hypothetical protein
MTKQELKPFASVTEMVSYLTKYPNSILRDGYGRQWKYENYAFWFKDISSSIFVEKVSCLHLFGTIINPESDLASLFPTVTREDQPSIAEKAIIYLITKIEYYRIVHNANYAIETQDIVPCNPINLIPTKLIKTINYNDLITTHPSD